MTTTLVRPTMKVPRNVYKGCQRCGGDLVLDREAEVDLRGSVDYVCLQCGRHVSIRGVLQLLGAVPQPQLTSAVNRPEAA
jgi:predicted SprT family Zn-dependent metalloprotease